MWLIMLIGRASPIIHVTCVYTGTYPRINSAAANEYHMLYVFLNSVLTLYFNLRHVAPKALPVTMVTGLQQMSVPDAHGAQVMKVELQYLMHCNIYILYSVNMINCGCACCVVTWHYIIKFIMVTMYVLIPFLLIGLLMFFFFFSGSQLHWKIEQFSRIVHKVLFTSHLDKQKVRIKHQEYM